MTDTELAVARLFSGFDRVRVNRDVRNEQTIVEVTLTDESFADVRGRRYRALHLSSRASEEALAHRDGQMRFYGRNPRFRNRNR